jgi:hypothetical protein
MSAELEDNVDIRSLESDSPLYDANSYMFLNLTCNNEIYVGVVHSIIVNKAKSQVEIEVSIEYTDAVKILVGFFSKETILAEIKSGDEIIHKSFVESISITEIDRRQNTHMCKLGVELRFH